jgi:hypothetical protein
LHLALGEVMVLLTAKTNYANGAAMATKLGQVMQK